MIAHSEANEEEEEEQVLYFPSFSSQDLPAAELLRKDVPVKEYWRIGRRFHVPTDIRPPVVFPAGLSFQLMALVSQYCRDHWTQMGNKVSMKLSHDLLVVYARNEGKVVAKVIMRIHCLDFGDNSFRVGGRNEWIDICVCYRYDMSVDVHSENASSNGAKQLLDQLQEHVLFDHVKVLRAPEDDYSSKKCIDAAQIDDTGYFEDITEESLHSC